MTQVYRTLRVDPSDKGVLVDSLSVLKGRPGSLVTSSSLPAPAEGLRPLYGVAPYDSGKLGADIRGLTNAVPSLRCWPVGHDWGSAPRS